MTTPSSATPDLRSALKVGLLDAAGFVIGGFGGLQVGRWLGVDPTQTTGFGADTVLAMLPLLVGLGIGRWASKAAARRLLAPPVTPPRTEGER